MLTIKSWRNLAVGNRVDHKDSDDGAAREFRATGNKRETVQARSEKETTSERERIYRILNPRDDTHSDPNPASGRHTGAFQPNSSNYLTGNSASHNVYEGNHQFGYPANSLGGFNTQATIHHTQTFGDVPLTSSRDGLFVPNIYPPTAPLNMANQTFAVSHRPINNAIQPISPTHQGVRSFPEGVYPYINTPGSLNQAMTGGVSNSFQGPGHLSNTAATLHQQGPGTFVGFNQVHTPAFNNSGRQTQPGAGSSYHYGKVDVSSTANQGRPGEEGPFRLLHHKNKIASKMASNSAGQPGHQNTADTSNLEKGHICDYNFLGVCGICQHFKF